MTSIVDRVADRGWRAYADARRRLSGDGNMRGVLTSLGGPDRSDIVAWNDVTSQDFDRYREVHPPAAGGVAVVCVSRRPELIDAVARNVERQSGIDAELVFVANHDGFSDLDPEARLRHLARVTVIDGCGATLGRGLNTGMAATTARFVAKFDDDDWYGPGYLVDSLRAHSYAGAAVVGKHAYYAQLSGHVRRYLRFPGHDFEYSSTLAGGTLVIDRGRTGDLAFDDVSLGEDRRFLATCHRRGWSTFSGDRFNFVQHRGHDNTWRPTDRQFLAGSLEIDPADDAHSVGR